MEVNFKKLELVKKYQPKIIKLKLASNRPPLYNFIRFWGRLPDYLLDDLITYFKEKGKSTLFDPFGGSGSVMFKGIESGIREIIYNDLNSAFTFITESIYKGLYIPRNILESNINSLILSLTQSPIIRDLQQMDNMRISKIVFDKWIILNSNIKLPEDRNKEINKIEKKVIKYLIDKKQIPYSLLRDKIAKEVAKKGYTKITARAIASLTIKKLLKKKIISERIKKEAFIVSIKVNNSFCSKTIRFNEKLEKIMNKKEKKYQLLINEDVFSYPLYYNSDTLFEKAENVRVIGDLYPTWSKIFLSVIWKEIEDKKYDANTTNVFKTCFLASLYDSSLMQMPHKSGWIVKSFWIPTPCAVKNPLDVFIKKLKKFLDVHDYFQEKIKNKTNVKIYNKNILDFSLNEFEKRPDIVITHPPYFSTIQYGELSAIWSAWLKQKIPFEEEIVENVRQNKNKEVYLRLLKEALKKIILLAKNNADIVFIFQSKDQGHWEMLDGVLIDLPIELEEIRCYRRSAWWDSSHLFNIGNYDYALIFKKR